MPSHRPSQSGSRVAFARRGWAHVWAASLLCSGCLWSTREGPVPRALVRCRELSSRGVSAMQRNEYQRAESLLAKAVETYDLDADARRHYAEALWHKRQHAKALGQLDQAIKLAGEDAVLLARRAEWHLELGNIPSAKEDVERALDADPRAPRSWLLRARIGRHTGELSQTLADYHRVLSLDAGHREALLEKSEVHWQLANGESQGQAQLHRVLATLQALLATYPHGKEPVEVLFLAGRTYARLSRHDDAAGAFAMAATHGGANAEVLYHLAEAQYQAGRPAEALATVRQSLAVAPGYAASQELLNRVQLAMGQPAANVLR